MISNIKNLRKAAFIAGGVIGFFFFGSSLLNQGDSIFLGLMGVILVAVVLAVTPYLERNIKKYPEKFETMYLYFNLKLASAYVFAGVFFGIALSPYILSVLGLYWAR